MPTIKMLKTVDVKVNYLEAECEPRYWEDTEVNGVKDEHGRLIPCRFKGSNYWRPMIRLEDGYIVNWVPGTSAKIHYKVCDAGIYTLYETILGKPIKQIDGYVPKILSPGGDGYGDYVIMNVDENGYIENWEVVLDEFQDGFND